MAPARTGWRRTVAPQASRCAARASCALGSRCHSASPSRTSCGAPSRMRASESALRSRADRSRPPSASAPSRPPQRSSRSPSPALRATRASLASDGTLPQTERQVAPQRALEHQWRVAVEPLHAAPQAAARQLGQAEARQGHGPGRHPFQPAERGKERIGVARIAGQGLQLPRRNIERQGRTLRHRQIAQAKLHRPVGQALVAGPDRALAARKGRLAFAVRRQPGRAKVPHAGQIAQRGQHQTERGERPGDGARARAGPCAGDDHRAGRDPGHRIGQRLERLGPEQPLHRRADHPLGAFAQAAQLGRAAPHSVELGGHRHPLGHLGGDPGAAGAQAAVQRLQPWPGKGHHTERQHEQRHDDKGKARLEPPEHGAGGGDHHRARDQPRQPLAQPVAKGGHVADEAQAHVAAAPARDRACRHARRMLQQGQTDRQRIILPETLAHHARGHPRASDHEARGRERRDQAEGERGRAVHRLEEPARGKGRHAGGGPLHQRHEADERQPPPAPVRQQIRHRHQAASLRPSPTRRANPVPSAGSARSSLVRTVRPVASAASALAMGEQLTMPVIASGVSP